MRKIVTAVAAAVMSVCVSARDCNVKDFGATGDGKTKDTTAVQKAIDCASESGGGTVTVPAGVYVCGSIFLKNDIDFHLEAGAVILGSPDKEDYNAADVCPQNSTCAPESSFGAHLILCIEQKNVRLRGPGRIDGNSMAFIVDKNGVPWPEQDKIKWRPSQMVYFVECDNVRVEDIELIDAPYWSSFYHGCTQVFIRGARIENRRNPHTHNGDGIDIDCCEHVSISDCHIRTADDCITLRGNDTRLKVKRPCRWVTVSNCTLSSPCNAIRVGVGAGRIENAVFNNLVIENSRTAFNFVATWARNSPGVDIRNIRVSNVVLDCAILTRMYMNGATRARIKDISFSDISGRLRPMAEIAAESPRIFDTRAKWLLAPQPKVVDIIGDAERPIENISFTNVRVTRPTDSYWSESDTRNVTRRDVTF